MSRISGALAGAGSVTGGIGVAMALEPGRGRTAVPVRSALSGSVVAVAALTAAAVFGTSLASMITTPRAYGQNWNAQLDLEFYGAPGALGTRILATEPAITGYAAGNYGTLTIAGQTVPAIGLDQPRGGDYLTIRTGSAVSVPDETTLCRAQDTCYNFFLLRYRPGTDESAAAAALSSAITSAGCPRGFCAVTADQRPSDIKHYASVRDTPLVLAAALILFAAGTLAHVLLTGVRRRRRDLALLKSLGFTRRQVLGAVAWEASAFAAVALLIGLPLGVVAGRWAWALFANAAGVSATAIVPLGTVLLAVPATLLLANVIAAAPGWEAARLCPAAVLRAE